MVFVEDVFLKMFVWLFSSTSLFLMHYSFQFCVCMEGSCVWMCTSLLRYVSCALSLDSLLLLLVSSYPYPSLFAFISSLIYLFLFLLPVGCLMREKARKGMDLSEWRGEEDKGRVRERENCHKNLLYEKMYFQFKKS